MMHINTCRKHVKDWIENALQFFASFASLRQNFCFGMANITV